MSRRSEIPPKTNNNTDFNISLFEHALKDPASKALILNLLSANQKNVFELFKPTGSPAKTPVKRVKRKEHCESPTALLRRRELEKINRPESVLSHTSGQSSKSSSSGRSSCMPFERILNNVVAYVEISSNGNDRSGGAKALLKSMGATVSEKFTRDVTHVIFKDGLYTTYQRAKLLKVNLVSVLWLEATRRNGVRAQEKNYPALGTKNYDLNVSMICSQMQKDYEDVIRDEIRRTLESGTSLPSTKSLLESRRKTVGSSSKLFDTSSQLVSQSFNKNDEVHNILSKIRGQSTAKKSKPSSMILHDDSPAVSTDEDLSRLSKRIQSDLLESSDTFRPSSLSLDQDGESDSASECGIINGDFSQKESIIEDTFDGISPLQSDEVFTSNMELTCADDSDSYSLRRRTINATTSMELTASDGGGILQNLKGSLLNSLSYLTSRNRSLVKKNDDKENFATPSYKTPNTVKLKSVRSRSTIKKKVVETDVFSTPSNENENFMSEDDFYNLKTPKLAVSKPKLKPVKILSMENVEENADEENAEKAIRTSDNSKEKSNLTANSTETSSETNKKSMCTSMSSLRLSKSSLGNSSSSNMPPLRISSEKESIERTNQELNVTPQQENDNTKNMDSQIELPHSTPFVTERKKRNNQRTMRIERTSSSNSCVDESETSSVVPPRNTRSLKRESSVLDAEKQKFTEELKNSKASHDKNKEIELATLCEEQPSTPRPAKKFASKTPLKSDILDSPFVNTRPRRKSMRTVEEKKVDCSIKSVTESPCDSTRRRSSRISGIKCTSTPKKNASGKVTISESHLEKKSEEVKSVSETKQLYNISEEDELSDLNKIKSLKPVVLPQQALVTPEVSGKWTRSRAVSQHDSEISKVRTSDAHKSSVKRNNNIDLGGEMKKTPIRTKSVVISETDKILADTKENEIVQDKIERKSRRTQRLLPPDTSVKEDDVSRNKRKIEYSESNKDENIHRNISRSKSESNICDSKTRKSKRIRKLYDPNQIDSEEIQETLGVNDQEERKTFRQEKCLRVNVTSQNNLPNGNLLMSQKAMDFLDKAKTNQDNMTIIFKKPESVLEELGIDRTRRNVKKKESIMNNSADEQIDLAEEFVNKKKMKIAAQENEATQKTPSTRKTMRNITQKALTTGNSKRRSTMDFAPKPLNMPKARTKLILDQKPTIVCTKMHKADVQVFSQIVKKLGRFEVEDEVSARTTHLVVGEPKRTVNMLRALSRGCWILKHEWLLSSLEQGKWLREEEYEATEFSPTVQQCRLRRQAFGPSYNMNVFLDCGMIYVAKSTMPRCSDLRELITLCKGKVTKIPDNAEIAVGAYFEECECVSELWVLDSITDGKLKPLEEYFITPEVVKTRSPFL